MAGLDDLPTLLDEMNAQTVLLCHGGSSFTQTGTRERLRTILRDRRVRYFSDYSPNPTVEDINRATRVFAETDPDTVIAIGGGSVMDTAKLARFFAAQHGDARRYFLEPGEFPVIPPRSRLICAPTTSGTGSESTQFATLYIDRRKYSLDHPCCLPDRKILDADLVISLPVEVTRNTGLDALCHALESLWSKRATPQSREKSLAALDIILANLAERVRAPTPDNAYRMLQAASLAGEAIQVARTTASHAISYPLTSLYGLPHGLAVALTVRQLLAFNEDAIDVDVKAKTVERLGLDEFSDLQRRLAVLFEQIGMKTSLRAYGLDTDAVVETLLPYVSPERLSNNPKPLEPDDIRRFLSGTP